MKANERREARRKRQRRVRNKVHGLTERPRLTVYRSLKHIYAQIIDDETGKTIISFCSLSKDYNPEEGKPGTIDGAKQVGMKLGKIAMEKGVTKVVFDRAGFLYHGRVKAVAEGARESGLLL